MYTALDGRVDALEAATALVYNYTKTISEVGGGWSHVGDWPTIGPWAGASWCITVPTGGVYLVTFEVQATSGDWTGVTHHRIDVGGVGTNTYGVSSTVPNVGEDYASVSCVTPHISAGTAIVPVYHNGGSTQRWAQATLTVVRLST